jgi:hypothetical protein
MNAVRKIVNQEPRLVALTLVGLIVLGLAINRGFLFLAPCFIALLLLLHLNQFLRRSHWVWPSATPCSRRRFL